MYKESNPHTFLLTIMIVVIFKILFDPDSSRTSYM